MRFDKVMSKSLSVAGTGNNVCLEMGSTRTKRPYNSYVGVG